MEPCVHRWFVDVSSWQPGSPNWDNAVRLLPAHELQKVMRFLFAKDQRLALASRLLQRRLIQELFNVPISQIDIQRTPEGKPFWNRKQPVANGDDVPPETWNYNVSHHGTVVAIASHPHRLVGIDVVQISERPGNNRTTGIEDFFRAFENHFNISEWTFIRSGSSAASPSPDDQYKRFYQLWSLKEAYIKAVGIGLGFALLRAEFAFNDAHKEWQLTLDGRLASDWRFESMQLDATHLVSVAYGPLDAMWSPATSSIFSSSSVAFSYTSGMDDGDSGQAANCVWERKDLADLIT